MIKHSTESIIRYYGFLKNILSQRVTWVFAIHLELTIYFLINIEIIDLIKLLN